MYSHGFKKFLVDGGTVYVCGLCNRSCGGNLFHNRAGGDRCG